MPPQGFRCCAQRLTGVDGTDDDEPRRRPEYFREDLQSLVLEEAGAPHLARDLRQAQRVVTDDLAALDEHEHLATELALALDDSEEHRALVAVREREQRLRERQSGRSINLCARSI